MDKEERFDIDERLDEIIHRHHLDRYYPRWQQKREAEAIIRHLADGWTPGKRQAMIVATKEKAYRDILKYRILRLLPREVHDSIDFYRTDLRPGVHSWAQVYDCDEKLQGLAEQTYEHVYFLSYEGHPFVPWWLRRHGIAYEDLYEIFAARELFLQHEYFEVLPDRTRNYWGSLEQLDPILMEVFEQQRRIDSAEDAAVRSQAMEKLFFLSLAMRNFALAEETWSKFSDGVHDACHKAWTEISRLLDEIRARLQARQEADGCVFWFDKTTYEQSVETPFIHSMLAAGTSFAHLYIPTPYTSPVFRLLFTGKMNVRDQSWSITSIGKENSPLLQLLENDGYDANIIAGDGVWRELREEYWTEKYMMCHSPSSERLWQAWRSLLASPGQKKFLLVHLLIEPHMPCFHTKMTDETVSWGVEDRKYMGQLDADAQLAWYTQTFGENAIRIYMSDHGADWCWTRWHCFFGAVGKGIAAEECQSLVSYQDFAEIIRQLIEERRIDEPKLARTHVDVEDVDFYHPRYLPWVVRNKGNLPEWPYVQGYRGILTKEYVYLRFHDGREWLWDRSRWQPELKWFPMESDICDPAVLERMRKLLDDDWAGETPQFERTDFYRKYIMSTMQRALPYNLKKIDALKEIVSAYPDGSIAIRMGGRHTYFLLAALTKELRKKFCCIIDRDTEARPADWGIPRITLDEAEAHPESIRYVLFSSFKYRDQLKEEARSYPVAWKTIDLYDAYEKRGIHCTTDFFYCRPKKEDWATLEE